MEALCKRVFPPPESSELDNIEDKLSTATMRSSRCVFNTATALHRVFVTPIEQPPVRLARRSTPLRQTPYPPALSLQRRSYFVARPAGTEPSKSRLPRDEEITSSAVTLVAPDGKLQAPQRTRDILASLDRVNYSLVVVVAGEAGDLPICKIIDKKAEWAAAKARKKQQGGAKAPVTKTKTVELNWAIEQGDLAHRLVRIKEFLEKGNKVEIVLAAKRKGRAASEEEAQVVLQKVKEAIEEVGGKESKPREGKLLGITTIFAELKSGKN